MQFLRRCAAVAITAAMLMVVSACGGSDSDSNGEGPSGDPVSGGELRLMQWEDPRTLDPASYSAGWSGQGFLGNSLFGTLLTDDPATGDIQPSMLESLESDDGGATFVAKLRAGLKFTDGTPFDAAALKFGWERIKDPAVGGANAAQANLIAATEVVDETTLKVTLVSPIAAFASVVTTSSMNYIGSPTALQAGAEAFNGNPIGAGPFILESWTRGAGMKLVRNDGYWDAPRPYLDRIELVNSSDSQQRFNALSTGLVDVVADQNAALAKRAEDAGFIVHRTAMSGANSLAFNTRLPVFADVRAREAVSKALDVDVINDVVFQGASTRADSLFNEKSPFHTGQPLREHDPERAQALFDELAAEGSPLSFTITTAADPTSRAFAESMQARWLPSTTCRSRSARSTSRGLPRPRQPGTSKRSSRVRTSSTRSRSCSATSTAAVVRRRRGSRTLRSTLLWRRVESPAMSRRGRRRTRTSRTGSSSSTPCIS